MNKVKELCREIDRVGEINKHLVKESELTQARQETLQLKYDTVCEKYEALQRASRNDLVNIENLKGKVQILSKMNAEKQSVIDAYKLRETENLQGSAQESPVA